jgi:hypothetical protein
MKKYLLMLVMMLGLGHASLAMALTLDDAKAQGLVGERPDGYIAAVSAAPSDDVKALVTTTNDGRRKVYAELAQRNGITVQAVGVVSGEKLQGAAPAGQYILTPTGEWQQK